MFFGKQKAIQNKENSNTSNNKPKTPIDQIELSVLRLRVEQLEELVQKYHQRNDLLMDKLNKAVQELKKQHKD